MIDLQRAMKLRREHYQGPFDDLVLSFAIYQRGATGNTNCGIISLRKVLYPDWPVDPRPVKDAGVEALSTVPASGLKARKTTRMRLPTCRRR